MDFCPINLPSINDESSRTGVSYARRADPVANSAGFALDVPTSTPRKDKCQF
jgi:hypothetical protein